MDRVTVCPEPIAEVQPSDFTTLYSGEKAVFILWPRKAAEEFLRLNQELTMGRKMYPLGTFPNGDLICWEDGAATVILHEDDEQSAFKTRWSFDEFLDRVMARDTTLEREMFRKTS
jgi:hypothetical protein